jgi:hypothetical protein
MRFAFPCAVASLLVATSGPARADDLCSTPTTAPAPTRMKELGEALAARIDACASEARRADGETFWKTHALEATPARLRDYVRTRTLFELTRDGGPWRVRWSITNEEPSAKKVWASWAARPPTDVSSAPSVTAECDEISALFAGLGRRLGVRGLGLFWPTKDHTIAAWEPAAGVRVLIPTTQIYVACDDTFDHVPFSPKVQKTVFEFSTADTPDNTPVPPSLATFLLDQVTHYAGASLEVLAAMRIHRALTFGSSVQSSCRKTLRGATLTAGDRRALLRYGATELGIPSATAADVLDRLARP